MINREKMVYDAVVERLKKYLFVIPVLKSTYCLVKTGIQSFRVVAYALDTRLRGYDDFL